ncbi:MAG: matrixin family metalloprotease, partial [Thermoanaerobaculia bacterium]
MRLPVLGWREEKSAAGGPATLFSLRHEAPPLRRASGARASSSPSGRGRTVRIRNRAHVWGVLCLLLGLGGEAAATSVIPIGDRELFRRADLVVYGVVASSETVEDPRGRPETVTEIQPILVVKGALAGNLVLRQAGGVLPDGRFFKLWGRPEYTVGHEVIVFAIARPEGDYQTAEMLLGKFEVERDDAGRLFAVPDLARGPHPGVTVHRLPVAPDAEHWETGSDELPSARFLPEPQRRAPLSEQWNDSPREIARFLDFLDAGAAAPLELSESPVGRLEAVVHPADRAGLAPQWGYINNNRWRWNNGATAGWAFDGTANMTGGGTAQATGALAAWTNDPNSTINYTANPAASNPLHLSAFSSPCGWSTCLSGGGVIGCGGPAGGGSNSWRGDSYYTITSGEVWLRCYATFNGFGSVTTQSVLTHELGHTLGLGHSDQNFSPHDTCSGDESAAMMRSSAQNRTTLGTDDQDAIRWIYGDGGNSCTSLPAPTVSSVTPSFGSIAGGTATTIT